MFTAMVCMQAEVKIQVVGSRIMLHAIAMSSVQALCN